jgi:2-oxoglutarate ferredoxin oxidoreductase subunit alpha
MVNPKGNVYFLQGNEAIVKGAIAVGVRFYAGYPITPSTEIAEILSEELPKLGGKYIQMEDEIGSIACVIGASIAGLKAMTATSGPGFSLMQENIGFACMAEVPCVIVNVQRVGPSTGIPTHPAQGDMMQARWGTHGDHPIVALAPSSVKECFDLTIKAFNLSEKYRVPVIILSDEIIGHMREKVELPAPDSVEIINRIKPSVPPEWYKPYDETSNGVPPMANFGEGYRYNITGLTHDRMGFPTLRADETRELMGRLMKKTTYFKSDIIMMEEFMLRDAEIMVFAYGSVARVAMAAIRMARERGIKVGLLKPLTVWPFPKIQVERLSKKINTVIVAELNAGQMVYEVERVVKKDARVERLNKYDGELFTPGEILDKIMEVV